MYILRKCQCFLTLDAFKPVVGDFNTILEQVKNPFDLLFKWTIWKNIESGEELEMVISYSSWSMCVQVEDSLKMANALLSDLHGFRPLVRFCDELQEQMRSYEQEQFEDWTRDLLSGLSDPKSGIRLTHTHTHQTCWHTFILFIDFHCSKSTLHFYRPLLVF